MATDTLDRLLTTFAVRIHAFAVCEIKAGWRLAFGPLKAVTIHYVLAGTGAIRVEGAVEAAYAPFSIIVVPSGVSQSLGEAGAAQGEVNGVDSCGPAADGLVGFVAGDGSRDTFVVCATISASYAVARSSPGRWCMVTRPCAWKDLSAVGRVPRCLPALSLPRP